MATCVAAVFLGDFPNYDTKIILLSLVLLFYVIHELLFLKRKNNIFFPITVVLFFSLNFFVLSFGAGTNYFVDVDIFKYDSYDLELVSRYKIKTLSLVIFSCWFFYVGYSSNLGYRLANRYNLLLLKKLDLRPLNLNLVLCLGFVLNIIRMMLIKGGAYGRIVDQSNDITLIVTRLRFVGDACLLLVVFGFFNFIFFPSSFNALKKYLFYILVFSEILFALLTGARFPIVALSIVFGVLYFLKHKKINAFLVLVFIFVLYFSFTIVNQYKSFVTYDYQAIENKGPIDILTEFVSSDYFLPIENDNTLLLEGILRSTNFLEDASIAVLYKDNFTLPDNTPGFKTLLLLSPINAVIPISFFGLDNSSDLGYWFRVNILNDQVDSIINFSAAMSAIGFTYLGLGVFGTLLFFYFYGVVLKFTDTFLLLGPYGKLLFLTLFLTVGILDSGIHGTLAIFIRSLVYFPICLYFFSMKLRRT